MGVIGPVDMYILQTANLQTAASLVLVQFVEQKL